MTTERNAVLRNEIRRRGFNTVTLARRLGVRPSHISHLMAGRRRPSLVLAYACSKLLDKPIEALFFPDGRHVKSLDRNRRRG